MRTKTVRMKNFSNTEKNWKTSKVQKTFDVFDCFLPHPNTKLE